MNAVAVANSTRNLVRLWADRLCVAIDLNRVQGIERADRIQSGILRTQQAEWQVRELATLLGNPGLQSPRGQVVLLELKGERFGLRVDRISSVSRVSVEELLPLPPGLTAEQQQFFTHVVQLDGQPVLLLEPEMLHPGAMPRTRLVPAQKPRVSPEETRPANRAMVFSIGIIEGRAVGFVLPAANVEELLDAPQGNLLPNTDSHAQALVPWRGRALVRIDLATWCGLPALKVSGPRVAVVRLPDGGSVAINIGAAVKLINLPLSHIPTRRNLSVDTGHVLGIFDTNEYTLIVPDLRKLCG